jgi:hypothetical protein
MVVVVVLANGSGSSILSVQKRDLVILIGKSPQHDEQIGRRETAT